MLVFNVITIFPEMLETYLKTSLLGKAQTKKLIRINLIQLRKFARDKHHKVDDKPFGGGPGMVMKLEPIMKAVQSAKAKTKGKTHTILFSTRGKKFDQAAARRLSKYRNLVLICGRYEGVDERVPEYIADEEISIGDFVLQGGELPALIVIEAVSRHIKGVLGKYESLEEVKGSYPVYTRPEVLKLKNGKKLAVPDVLLSGNHKKIEEWRKNAFDK